MKLLSSMALAVAMALIVPIATAPASAQKAGTEKSTTAKAATPATKPKAEPKKTASASPCKGLSQTQCSANKSCGWITPTKKVSTDGRKLTAYCRKVAAKK